MEYPILIGGRETGKLTITPMGPATVFEAVCEDNGEVLRLSVYGESEGYLGVMTPNEGKLHLKKKLSRASMRGFPKQVTHAGPSGAGAGQKEGESAARAAAKRETSEKTPAGTARGGAAAVSGPGKASADAPHSGEPGTDLLWYRTPDGTLFTTWEGRSFMAVPDTIKGLPMEKCLEHRPIEGTVYAVFETKKGKIV